MGRPRKVVDKDDDKSLVINEIDIGDKFTDKAERKLAAKLLSKYLHDYTIESIAEVNTLKDVIYFEVVQIRLQDKLNEMYASEAKVMNFDTLDKLHKNADVINKLKDSLGLRRGKDKLNPYDAFQSLVKRFAKWREENQASRHFKCPHCLKWTWLKIRVEHWEAQQHPFFQDNFLHNKYLISNLGKTILIDERFISQVYETSPDYIQWSIKKTNNTERSETNGQEDEEASSEEVKEEVVLPTESNEELVNHEGQDTEDKSSESST